MDSIIAKPTNSVRVMVDDASGCCAIELNAEATDFPSPKAGIMQPTPVVRPAVIIDATAIIVVLSMLYLFFNDFIFKDFLSLTVTGSRSYVNRSKNGENIRLYHSRQHPENAHDNRKEKRRNGK